MQFLGSFFAAWLIIIIIIMFDHPVSIIQVLAS